MKRLSGLLVASVLSAAAGPAPSPTPPRYEPKLSSKYSPLAGPRCAKPRELAKDGGSSVQRCPGVAGYALNVEVDDDRSSITVVSPEEKAHPLNFGDVVTGKFSHLGEQAEWLLSDQTPIALIVRVIEGGESAKAYLTVAKITSSDICVVASLPAGKKGANDKARAAGEKAASAPCLKELSR